MPVHDGAAFLDEAIASVLGQDFEDLELVVVDDGSSDRTPEILAAWSGRDARVVVHRLETRRGLAAALNAGISVVRAPLIARLDADDVVLAGRFAAQVRALAGAPT